MFRIWLVGESIIWVRVTKPFNLIWCRC